MDHPTHPTLSPPTVELALRALCDLLAPGVRARLSGEVLDVHLELLRDTLEARLGDDYDAAAAAWVAARVDAARLAAERVAASLAPCPGCGLTFDPDPSARYYDDTLNDDASHPHVLAARDAGRAWAEREWDALDCAQQAAQRGEAWYPTDTDARPLVEFDPTDEIEEREERERELSEICNAAASERWDELAGGGDSADNQQQSRLTTRGRMSNTGYHANGKPTWWARVGSGSEARFLSLPRVRGDSQLDCVVDVPPGTTVHCGAGKGSRKTIRETVVTVALRDEEVTR